MAQLTYSSSRLRWNSISSPPPPHAHALRPHQQAEAAANRNKTVHEASLYTHTHIAYVDKYQSSVQACETTSRSVGGRLWKAVGWRTVSRMRWHLRRQHEAIHRRAAILGHTDSALTLLPNVSQQRKCRMHVPQVMEVGNRRVSLRGAPSCGSMRATSRVGRGRQYRFSITCCLGLNVEAVGVPSVAEPPLGPSIPCQVSHHAIPAVHTMPYVNISRCHYCIPCQTSPDLWIVLWYELYTTQQHGGISERQAQPGAAFIIHLRGCTGATGKHSQG